MSASQFQPGAPLQDVELTGVICEGSIGIGACGDHVVITAAVPVSEGNLLPAHIMLDPETAKLVGECIARSGYAVESRQDVYGKKPIIIEQIRKRLVIAVAHLLKGDAERGENLDITAQRCVEIMLTEVQ